MSKVTFPERIAELNSLTSKGLRECMKKPIAINAVQIHTEFRVDTLEGDYKQGKAGDYLMCGIEGELYICDKGIFEKSYDWIGGGDYYDLSPHEKGQKADLLREVDRLSTAEILDCVLSGTYTPGIHDYILKQRANS